MSALRRPATIADVAALAEVSVGTASKALNGRGQLRPQTRERVLAAADRLGFHPNELARGLLAGRSFTVGLITTDSFGRFSIPVMLGVEDALGAGQISVFLCDGRGDPIREQHYIRTLLARRVDGIIVTGRRADPRSPIAADLPVPVVYAMTRSDDPADCSLVPDDAAAAGWPSSTCSPPGAPASGTSPDPSGSWPPGCGPRAPAPRSPRPAGNWPGPACSTASGASSGAGRRSTSCCARRPTWTPYSAAPIRSRAVWPTRCAMPAGGYRTTSRWSASTTGR